MNQKNKSTSSAAHNLASVVQPVPTFAQGSMPLVPQSWGEIIDKITILEIKSEKLTDTAKLANVRRELLELVTVREQHFPAHTGLAELSAKLKKVNESLWWIEDDIRDCERAKDFGPKFIELARAVYVTNDQRGAVKREINDLLGSALVEEKSYAAYTEDQQKALTSVVGTVAAVNAKKKSFEKYDRLDAFIERCRERDLYPEPPSDLHTGITRQQLDWLGQRWPLTGKSALDVGCGQGVALELFAQRGVRAVGITFGEDFRVCKTKGFEVREMDMSFLDFPTQSFDLIWARHALEHSLFPRFTLEGFFTVLKSGGRVYVEVPAPDTIARHQDNPNHYSCLTASSWLSLFHRSGFDVLESFQINVQLSIGPDAYFVFLLGKS
jgi:SAM-dependent methyltransferase